MFLRALILILCLPGAALAQGLFAPAITVNDEVVTRWELQSRTAFLRLLNAPGDPAALAAEQLVAEKLQTAAARDAGIEPSEDELAAAEAEFAARANLTAAEFVEALEANGVDGDVFRAFIRAGVTWRTYVQETFRDAARQVDEDDVRRALEQEPLPGGLRVLVTEIVLPAGDPLTRRASIGRAAEIRQAGSAEAFSAEARRFSVAPSRNIGGEVPWRPLEAFPEVVRPTLQALRPGQISRPVEGEGQFAMYYMRDRETVAGGTPASIDYATLALPGVPLADARARAQDLGSCDLLPDLARGAPAPRLQRQTLPAAVIPAADRAVLARLDAGEAAAVPGPAGVTRIVALCARTRGSAGEVDLELIERALVNQRIEALAAQALAALRQTARISPPGAGG